MSDRHKTPRALVVALLAAGAVLASACSDAGAPADPGERRASPVRPNVLVWLVDTLRADRTSAYGYERPTTPTLERLASGGVLFERFFVHSNWTQPSVASLLSGTYPLAFPKEFERRLPRDLVTAADWYGEAGYQTVGLTVTVATSARFGFDQGFDRYDELDAHLDLEARQKRAGDTYHARNVVESALAWIDGAERRPERPFFMFLHTMDPHMPVQRHEGYRDFAPADYDGPLDGSVATMSAHKRSGRPFTAADRAFVDGLYDGEVHYNDAWLGRLVDALDERGLLEDTLIVVVSDHGEELFDRGWHGHGQHNLHAELTHVPLVLHWPAGLPAGRRVEGLVRGIDLLPTLLEVTGLPPLPDPDGGSVAHEFDARHPRGSGGRDPGLALADRAKADADTAALRSEELLAVVDRRGEEPAERLFDLRSDPGERVDVAAQRAESMDWARERLEAWQAYRRLREQRLGTGGAVELTDELRRQLESLGYLDADPEQGGR